MTSLNEQIAELKRENEENKIAMAEMQKQMKEMLDPIRRITDKMAKEEGFDSFEEAYRHKFPEKYPDSE